jgi:L-lactate dehydrogenase (cytochrome)
VILADVADYRAAARRRLPRVLFDYIDGGAYGETTLAANLSAFQAIRLRQRVLTDVSALSMETEVLGQSLSMPVVLSPVGLAGMFRRRGEAQAARAAQGAGIPFTLSTVGVCSIAEVSAAAKPPWFQLYMIRDRGFMAEVLARAAEAGCPALLLTVDMPVPGARYRDRRNGMTASDLAGRLRQGADGLAHLAWMWDVYLRGRPHTLGTVAGGMVDLGQYWAWVAGNFDPSMTWEAIDWVRRRWSGPIMLKGILDVEDALEARRRGVDGIVVSNHGGRQLDGVPAAIDALPAIADAVGADLTVLMDGGVRSGLDVLRALARGARACLIGRAWAYALAARGESGVSAMLETLRQELRVAMSLTGCVDARQAGRALLAD